MPSPSWSGRPWSPRFGPMRPRGHRDRRAAPFGGGSPPAPAPSGRPGPRATWGRPHPCGRRAWGPAGSRLRGEIAAGLRVLWHDGPLRSLCAATALCNVGMGALIATMVLLVTGWLDAGNAGYAAAMTAYTVGSLTGGVLNGRLVGRLGRVRGGGLAGTGQIRALGGLG